MGCFTKMPVFTGHMWESICQKHQIVTQFSCVWAYIAVVPISAIGHHLHNQITECAVAVEEQVFYSLAVEILMELPDIVVALSGASMIVYVHDVLAIALL